MDARPQDHQAPPRVNTILGALPARYFDRSEPDLEPVTLRRGVVLEEPNSPIDFVYFPVAGLAVMSPLGAEGEAVDTTMVGREGMTGLPVFLGTGQMPVRTMVQVPLTGYRLP